MIDTYQTKFQCGMIDDDYYATKIFSTFFLHVCMCDTYNIQGHLSTTRTSATLSARQLAIREYKTILFSLASVLSSCIFKILAVESEDCSCNTLTLCLRILLT
jgi:hypothetical protein